MVRDLFVIAAQSNNSEYGDSRITGPYRANQMDIVKVKGGENTEILVGEIDMVGLLKHKHDFKAQQNKTIADYKKLCKTNPNMADEKLHKMIASHPKELKKPSARS